MAFTLQSEIDTANQSLLRLGDKSGLITLANFATNPVGVKANLLFPQTRNSLLRSFEWYWASTRTDLVLINTLTLDAAPTPANFAVGAILTGTDSGATCAVLEVTSGTVYVVAYLTGTFTDGEEISDNATIVNSLTCAAGYPVIAEDVPNDTHWEHQYQLPTDFLRKVSEHHGYHRHHFSIEGRRLYSNHDEFRLHYIRCIPNPDDWDALFKEFFVLQLALKLLPAIGGVSTPTLNAELQGELRVARAYARTVCAAETNNSGNSAWVNARFGSGKVFGDAYHR